MAAAAVLPGAPAALAEEQDVEQVLAEERGRAEYSLQQRELVRKAKLAAK